MRLQCGSEQWCCSFRPKTGCISTINMQSNGVEVVRDFHNHKKPMFTAGVTVEADEAIPEWVTIYFTKSTSNSFRCSICESVVTVTEKSMELLHHMQENHSNIYNIHKDNPDSQLGFRIEFLHLNMSESEDAACKGQPIILGELCDAATEEIIVSPAEAEKDDSKVVEEQALVKPTRLKAVKANKTPKFDSRKRSWVWKYFHKMSNIIFRCTLCDVVLSIKGCNTNNMNRHVRTRHPQIYKAEALKKHSSSTENLEQDFTEVETPIAVKTEEICASEKDLDDPFETSTLQRSRRSWIWLYFDRTSATTAQCKLCSRNISHGGNATGNMNRHLKMIHHKTGDDHTWVWKVFDSSAGDFYTCKICQFQSMKFNDLDKSIACILHHLKVEHGVISGDQIITSTEECDEVN